jgi:hypothetical protein
MGKSVFNIIQIQLILLLFCFLFSCSDEKVKTKIIPLTPHAAMQKFINMSPVKGAMYYAQNRNKYAFMDELYGDSILPVVGYCNYYELKKIAFILKNTPYSDVISNWRDISKKNYLISISKEVQANCALEKETFNKMILPAIEMDVDSMLEIDMTEIISKYSGGLFNYRKLIFFFGRDKKDFKKMFWDKFDRDKYIQHISDHIQTYLNLTSEKQNRYCEYITGKGFKESMSIDDPDMVVGLSRSSVRHVAKYTSGEKDAMVEDALKDWVAPMAIGTISGGLGTLYDIGSWAYDIKVSFDDVKAEKIDPDDMVRYVCANDVSYQLKNYYLNRCTYRVRKAIDKSNKRLLDKIKSEL